MKSERRHELQENELAAYLGKINRAIEPYSKLIAIVVGVIAVASIGLALYQNKTSAERSDATLALIQASASEDPAELAQISATYPGTAAGNWAQLYEGNAYLVEAAQTLYSDRAAAEDLIRRARSSLNEALSTSDNMILRSRAHFGLARAAEMLGEIDAAIDQYRECIEVNESEAMVELANERIESLSKPETKDFLAWFGDQDFAPADPSLPPSLPNNVELPDVPDIQLPDLGTDEEAPSDDGEMPVDKAATGGIEMPDDADASSEDATSPSAEGETSEPDSGAAPDRTSQTDARAKTSQDAPAKDGDSELTAQKDSPKPTPDLESPANAPDSAE
jgi:hypothetical protein